MMFLCIFCKNGSYSGDLCLSVYWKSSIFALEFEKGDIMKRIFTILAAMSTMTIMAQTSINIIVGGQTFTATLADSKTGEAFAALLPLTVTMNELNGNEKYHYLSSSLPTAAYQPGTIHAGDLMLYGNNCVVLFYETFNSSYSYTRIGSIDNPSGLAAALGSGNVSVQFVQADKSAVQRIYSNKTPCTKVMKNGVLFINHNSAMYNVLGEKVQ
jgi:hypothetical protein